MDDNSSNIIMARDSRCRVTRPERIDVGSDVLLRNDLIAKKCGTSERSVNRGDAEGAPYAYIGGVKYRPEKAYQEFLASRIVRRGQRRRAQPVRK
jgi:hypothetical protein